MTEPDRTIDAQIAEMREPKPAIPPDADIDLFLAGTATSSPLGMWVLGFCYERGDNAEWGPLNFSTDLNAAMRAYQEFRGKSPDDPPLLTLTKTIFRDLNKQWVAELEWIEGPSIEGLAATPAMAICLALLAALSKPATEPARSDKAKEVTK